MQAGHLKSSSNGLIVLTVVFILIVGQIMAGIFCAQRRSASVMAAGELYLRSPAAPAQLAVWRCNRSSAAVMSD